MIFGFKPDKVRPDFPLLKKGITYFDSACMSLKPIQVIEKMDEYYKEYPACGGRSIHRLASRVGEEVAITRSQISSLINAKRDEEIVFTRNTTEGINIIANGLNLKKGDEVVISDKEHNSNLIPWLRLAKSGIKVVIVESNSDNSFNLDSLKKVISKKTKLISLTHRSNLDGVTNPIKDVVKIAHDYDVKVLIDGAQSIPGMPVDIRDLGADYLVFSGHKMLGPTGTGILYGHKAALEALDQFIVGGETVKNSTYDSFIPEDIPARFEGGLQDYAGIVGLGEAAKYLRRIDLTKIESHEIKLNRIITEGLVAESKIRIIGPNDPSKRAGIFSFNIGDMDPHHVSKMLDVSSKIMTRSGAHCVHSWFNANKMSGSARASLYLYNTEEEAEKFVSEIKKIAKLA